MAPPLPRPNIDAYFDPVTGTYSYLVHDPATRRAAVIDPVLDYDAKSGRTSHASADRVIDAARAKQLSIDWILETHAHADHLSAAPYLKDKLGGRIAIGAKVLTVQDTFKRLFNLNDEFRADGSQFDHLFARDETFAIGEFEAKALFVPGHTPADMAYLVGDAVFAGDTLFLPDLGTARADFPGGDARALYRSARALLSLPAATAMFVCHDYPLTGRTAQCETTVAAQRERNIHVRDGISEEDFVRMREARDKTLGMPTLILPAIQVNIRGGRMPPADSNGIVYLRIPVNAV